MKRNKEFEHGYSMGYDLARYNGNADPRKSILERGIGLRTQYAVGFLKGFADYKKGLPQKYGKED